MKLSSARMVVTGATSVTGREILMLLADSGADKSLITAAESGRVKDNQLSFGEDGLLDLISQDEADFTGAHIVLHAGEAREAVGLARKATAAGAVFIDGTGTFALDPDVPLIVPEVNGALLADTPAKNIIASPAPLAVFLSLGLNPLHKQARVTRAVVSTYQSVSAWGREAQDELFSQTKAVFMAQESKSEHLPKQIAFNCYPMVGHERDDGVTDIEWQAVAQVKKILDPKIRLSVNTVTVPCFLGDGMMVNVECAEEVSAIKAALWMTGQQGLGVIEDDNFCTHADVSGEGFVYAARLRDDISVDNGVAFWLIGDNLRKGSAQNMVQIAETWLKTR